VAVPAAIAPVAAAASQESLAAPAAMAAARLNENIVMRSAQLDGREQLLQQRERELAEQRRILAEEYRLLRARHATAPAPGAAMRGPAAHPGRFDSEATQGFWSRVKRVMLGISAPTVEGS
jgi:hypothetical protein